MNLWITVLAIAFCFQLCLSKSADKSHPKKATSAKPTKGQKSIVEEFSELPTDDLEFVKELDNQFKVYGDNIKIKIEKENTTGKNLKRTIDGNLGYGYQHRNLHGFHFAKPKYLVYPYSQRDIPGGAAHHSDDAVQVQPSHAFEIKEASAGYQTYTPSRQVYRPQYVQPPYVPYQPAHTNSHSAAHQYVEPVIVLRIPGPAKYASHLQALLQRYLEIRAAQYLRALQETEEHQQSDSYETYHHTTQSAPEPHHQHHIQHVVPVYQRVQYQTQEQPQPIQYQQQVTYDTSDEVSHSAGQDQHVAQQYVYQQEEQPTVSENYQQHQIPDYGYQRQVYVPSTQSEQQADYSAATSNEQETANSHLPISENFPRNTHTKVLFTGKETEDHSTTYPLTNPSRRPVTRHHHVSESYQQLSEPSEQNDSYATEEPIVAITQRARGPFNYHAHRYTSSVTKPSKRYTPYSDEQFKKLDKLITRLKKKSTAHTTSDDD